MAADVGALDLSRGVETAILDLFTNFLRGADGKPGGGVRSAEELVSGINGLYSQMDESAEYNHTHTHAYEEQRLFWNAFDVVLRCAFSGRSNPGFEIIDELVTLLEKRKKTDVKQVPMFSGLPTTEDKEELCKKAFYHVRCGDVLSAAKVFDNANFYWRAASVLGIGATYRKACCEMEKQSDFGPWEKALYGALSGNVRSVLPVCQDWSDVCWAHFRAVTIGISSRTSDQTAAWDAEVIFGEIQRTLHGRHLEVYEATKTPTIKLIELLLMRRYADVLRLAEYAINRVEMDDILQISFLATATFALDVLQGISLGSNEIASSSGDRDSFDGESELFDIVTSIYAVYGRALASNGQYSQVPDVMHLLDKTTQVIVGCDILAGATAESVDEFLQSPLAFKLDLDAIVFFLIRNVCFAGDEELKPEERIRGFEWLQMKAIGVADTLCLFNELCRDFLASDHVECAHSLYSALEGTISPALLNSQVHPTHKMEFEWHRMVISAKGTDPAVLPAESLGKEVRNRKLEKTGAMSGTRATDAAADDMSDVEENLLAIVEWAVTGKTEEEVEVEFPIDSRIFGGMLYERIESRELEQIMVNRRVHMERIRQISFPYAICRLADAYVLTGEAEKLATSNPGFFDGIDKAGSVLSITRHSGFRYSHTFAHIGGLSTTHDLSISTIPQKAGYSPSATLSLKRGVCFVQLDPATGGVKAIVRATPFSMLSGFSIQMNGDATLSTTEVGGEWSLEEYDGRLDMSYEGGTFSTDVKYNLSGVLGISHLQNVFSGVAVGVRSFAALRGEEGSSDVATMGGVRIQSQSVAITGVGSNYGQFGISLLKRLSQTTHAALALVYNEKSGNTAKAGYVYSSLSGLANIRGVVDFGAGLVYTEATYKLTTRASATFSGSLDHRGGAHAFSISLTVSE